LREKTRSLFGSAPRFLHSLQRYHYHMLAAFREEIVGPNFTNMAL
jgi:hypothetical protein